MFNKKFSKNTMMWLSFVQAVCWSLFSIVFFRKDDNIGGFIFIVVAIIQIIIGIKYYIQNKNSL